MVWCRFGAQGGLGHESHPRNPKRWVSSSRAQLPAGFSPFPRVMGTEHQLPLSPSFTKITFSPPFWCLEERAHPRSGEGRRQRSSLLIFHPFATEWGRLPGPASNPHPPREGCTGLLGTQNTGWDGGFFGFSSRPLGRKGARQGRTGLSIPPWSCPGPTRRFGELSPSPRAIREGPLRAEIPPAGGSPH